MKKTAIVIPYFGEWPVWFPLYLHSLGKNPDFHVFLFTDIVIPEFVILPKNCHVMSTSFERYSNFVSEKLNIHFNPAEPYKLCDIKPTIPFIHSDILKDFEWVGWGDMDLVYGHLDRFFPDDMMEKYDIITTHSNIFAGHFTIVRNTPDIYGKFLKISRLKELMENPIKSDVAEVKFTSFMVPKLELLRKVYYRLGGYAGAHKTFATKMLTIGARIFYPRYCLKEFWTTPYHINNKKFFYRNGAVLDEEAMELPYIHFLFFKKTSYKPNADRYWKEEFYELGQDGIKEKTVIFDYNGIRYLAD